MVNLGEMHMDRRTKGFTGLRFSGPRIALGLSTALASMALASCTAAAPPAETSFAKAQAALEAGKVDNAISHAEAAVLADPRNSGFRALLGAAYLEAGRFDSAATAFGDAIELGHDDSRTVLSFALAKVAAGDNAAALNVLSQNEAAIPAADLGLALALAGQPERGVHYLVNAVRNGHSSPKARQNLAYAYALAGNWPAARVMAAEDVPADQIDARLSDWAATARPEDYRVRVANLLGVTPVSDGGQPQHLALANFPSTPMMVAEAEQMRAEEINADVVEVAEAVPAPSVETVAVPSQTESLAFGLRDIDTAKFVSNPVVQSTAADVAPARAPVPAPARVAAADPAPSTVAERAERRGVTPRVSGEAASRPASTGGPRFISNAVVQDVPAAAERVRAAAAAEEAQAAPAPASAPTPQRRMAVASGSDGTHLVQLGAFDSHDVAKSKWAEMQRRIPALAGHDVVITEARVNGRTYFRVAAAGFDNRSARAMCNTLKAGGRGCFAYAASSPPAGAVDRGVRIAARTR